MANQNRSTKSKPHKGLLKRVKITKSGKVRHRSAGHQHLRSRKAPKRLRRLRQDGYAAGPDAKRFEKLLFRRLRGRNQPKSALRRNPSPEQRRAMQAEKKAAAAQQAGE